MRRSWGFLFRQGIRRRYRHLLIMTSVVFVILVLLKNRDKIDSNAITFRPEKRTITCSKGNHGKSHIVDPLKVENSNKLVLFYTNVFGLSPWPTIENNYQFTNWDNIPCEVQNCRISYDKKDLNISDAVIFHGQDIDGTNLSKLSKTTSNRISQRWVFFIQESPLAFTHDLDLLEGVFNWTMSYKYSSDIFVPYFYYFPRKKELPSLVSENYAQGKNRLVAWVVSNCGPSMRNNIAKKLMEYIPVHVYGACSKKYAQNRTCERGEECHKTLRKYKFYLAFENTDCVDYITEKYWQNSLGSGIIPVVLGGGNYTDSRLAVPGSFINVLDFSSVRHLANYLVMLDKNDTGYSEYFKWRSHYHVGNPRSWTCQLCSMLNNATLPAKIYGSGSFKTFWGRKTNCGLQDYKMKLIA